MGDAKGINIKETFLDYYSFTVAELEKIFSCIKNRAEYCEGIKLDYSEEENNEFVTVLYAIKGQTCQKFCFYKNPVNLIVNGKEYRVNTIEQLLSILSQYNLNEFSFNIDGKEIKNKQMNYEIIKNISITKLRPKIELDDFGKYIKRTKTQLPLKEEIIQIEKNFLSFYFDDICISPDKKKNSVDFILENNRIEFINKINNFLNSKDIFYLVFGTKGIGKTITLLYYTSSLLHIIIVKIILSIL